MFCRLNVYYFTARCSSFIDPRSTSFNLLLVEKVPAGRANEEHLRPRRTVRPFF